MDLLIQYFLELDNAQNLILRRHEKSSWPVTTSI